MKKKILLCGATGFIGRNLLEHFLKRGEGELFAVYHEKVPPENLLRDERIQWIQADLTDRDAVRKAVEGKEMVLQAAATTSGAKEIVSKPTLHVTDNAVMNALLFRACHDQGVGHVVFLSCTVMYPGNLTRPVREKDFDHQITDKYFGSGWTKVYAEKMGEFYSRLGATKFTVIRHSNIYGPHDKFDLERSHVFGATVTKVMTAQEPGEIEVWGDGSEEKDLLHVEDLIRFVDRALELQTEPFDLVNVGAGRSVSVRELVETLIRVSGKSLKIRFNREKPTIPFRLALNIERAKARYGWSPEISLEEGIRKTLEWYRSHELVGRMASRW